MHEILCELNIGVQEGNKYADGVTTCIYILIYTLIYIHTHTHKPFHWYAIQIPYFLKPCHAKMQGRV